MLAASLMQSSRNPMNKPNKIPDSEPSDAVKDSPTAAESPHDNTQSLDHAGEARRILYSLGFAAKEHLLLAEKLLSTPPRESFERVIRSEKHRDPTAHLQALRELVRRVRSLDNVVDGLYADWRSASQGSGCAGGPAVAECWSAFTRVDRRLQTLLPRFGFRWRVLEELALVAENIEDKMKAWLHGPLKETIEPRTGVPTGVTLETLERFSRMLGQDYLAACSRLRAALEHVGKPLQK